MKKILFIMAIIMAGAMSAAAQTEKGQMGGGINILYGTEVGNIGVGAKYRQSLTDEFRAEATLDYFFKKDHHTLIDANVNIQYLLPIEGTDFTAYPILGVGIGNDHYCCMPEISIGGDELPQITVYDSFNQTVVGFNTGIGAEYAITDKAAVTLEARYQFFNKHCTQLLLGVGLVHKF